MPDGWLAAVDDADVAVVEIVWTALVVTTAVDTTVALLDVTGTGVLITGVVGTAFSVLTAAIVAVVVEVSGTEVHCPFSIHSA